ncbi:Hypothetical predicted protein, partial [Pelobates cultripes]
MALNQKLCDHVGGEVLADRIFQNRLTFVVWRQEEPVWMGVLNLGTGDPSHQAFSLLAINTRGVFDAHIKYVIQ